MPAPHSDRLLAVQAVTQLGSQLGHCHADRACSRLRQNLKLTLAGAQGDAPVTSRLTSIKMERDSIRFELDLEVAEAP